MQNIGFTGINLITIMTIIVLLPLQYIQWNKTDFREYKPFKNKIFLPIHRTVLQRNQENLKKANDQKCLLYYENMLRNIFTSVPIITHFLNYFN